MQLFPAMITANTVPNTTIHHGARGGILTAKSNPVSNAELSLKLPQVGCLRSLSTPASGSNSADGSENDLEQRAPAEEPQLSGDPRQCSN